MAGTLPCFVLGELGIEEAAWRLSPPLPARAWSAILGGCAFLLVFNTSIAIGIAITTPLFISIGTGLTIPATMVRALLASCLSLDAVLHQALDVCSANLASPCLQVVDVLIGKGNKMLSDWLGATLLVASFGLLVRVAAVPKELTPCSVDGEAGRSLAHASAGETSTDDRRASTQPAETLMMPGSAGAAQPNAACASRSHSQEHSQCEPGTSALQR